MSDHLRVDTDGTVAVLIIDRPRSCSSAGS
jgi:hypothetical protein